MYSAGLYALGCSCSFIVRFGLCITYSCEESALRMNGKNGTIVVSGGSRRYECEKFLSLVECRQRIADIQTFPSKEGVYGT